MKRLWILFIAILLPMNVFAETGTEITRDENDLVRLFIENTGTNSKSSAGVKFKNASGDSLQIVITNGGDGHFYLPSGSGYNFYIDGSNKVIIDSSGNVGIKTTSPDYALDVNGSIKAGANLIAKNLFIKSTTIDTTLPSNTTDFIMDFESSLNGKKIIGVDIDCDITATGAGFVFDVYYYTNITQQRIAEDITDATTEIQKFYDANANSDVFSEDHDVRFARDNIQSSAEQFSSGDRITATVYYYSF